MGGAVDALGFGVISVREGTKRQASESSFNPVDREHYHSQTRSYQKQKLMLKTQNHDKSKSPAEPNQGPAPPSRQENSSGEHNQLWQSLALSRTAIQPKLTVSQPDDPYEQAADRVADDVMRMTAPAAIAPDSPNPQSMGAKFPYAAVVSPKVQLKCEDFEEDERLPRKEEGGKAEVRATEPALVHETLNSPGHPLDPITRSFMEERFDHDFSRVRVHTDAQAAQSAREINAAAYTLGDDVVFGPGRHTPDTCDGRHLLAHELTHVIQQRQEPSSLIQRQSNPADKSNPVKEQNKPGELQDDKGKAETAKALDQAPGETKSITLSRGVLQMTSEGDFTESDTSVKRPHFPFNVNVFKKLTDAEIKTYDDAKKAADEEKKKDAKKGAFNKPYQRYATPDANGVFKKDDAGGYKMGALKDRHNTATYTTTLGADEQIGTTNNSGVTIGFGVDLGNRYSTAAEAKKDFTAAGIIDDKGAGVDGNKADKLLEAVGLKGTKAAEKAASLRSDGVALTVGQVLKLLNVIIPSYDKTAYSKGYSRGDGTLDPAIEEVLMALSYWGGKINKQVRAAIIKNAKDKEGAEQFRAAAKAIKDTKSSDQWMQRGYQIYISFLETLAEMKDSGYEINLSDSVSDPDTMTGAKKDANDDTLAFVKDLSERAASYKSKGKDLKKQISGAGLASLIADKVGEGKDAKNNEADVRVIQQLLYNGNYEVEVTGKYDDKTRTAIEKFTKDEFGKSSNFIDPGGKTLRYMKKFQYLKRAT